MKRRTRFLALATLFVFAAIVASIFLIPSDKEIALTRYKDKEYEEAMRLYKEQYRQGDVSIDTVMHLVRVHLQYAEVEDAIEVMEAFVSANPSHLGAREELGRLYQYGQRPEDYLRNLEEMNQLVASDVNSQKLLEQYRLNQNTDKNIPLMVKRIMNEKQAAPQDFRDLIRLLASVKRYEEALDMLVLFRERFPQKMRFSDHDLAMRLYADTDQMDKVADYANSLHELNLRPSYIAQVSNILLYRVRPQAAYDFISYYRDQIEDNARLFSQYIVILSNTGKQKQAYALMLSHYQDDRLQAGLLDDLMVLASLFGNQAVVSELREHIDYDQLDANEVLVLVDLAIGRDDRALLHKLNGRAKAMAEENNDFYLQAILLVANDKKSSQADVTAAMREELSFSRRLQLALLCARKGFDQCVNEFTAALPPADSLTDTEVVAVAQLLHDSGKLDSALTYLSIAREMRENTVLDAAWFPMAAAREDVQVIRDYLKDGVSFNADIYEAAYYSAMKYKRYQNAVEIAEYLYGGAKTPLHRTFVTQAYLKSGQYAEVLPLLRQSRSAGGQTERDYLYVLSKLARSSPEHAAELRQYGLAILRQGTGEKRRQAIIYALVDGGQEAYIMPYIRDMAIAQPRAWASLYADHLAKTKQQDVLVNFWQQVADKHPNDSELHAQIAYNLLQHGQRDTAIAMFASLATASEPDSPLVQQLLYLWGPVYERDAVVWIIQRANGAADAIEHHQWLDLLAAGVTDEQLHVLAAQYPAMLDTESTEFRYIEALAAAQEEGTSSEAVGAFLDTRIASAQQVKRLMRYGELAGQYELEEHEKRAYLKALDVSPNNPLVLGALGVAYYNDADYSEARTTLQRYFHGTMPQPLAQATAYRPHFSYAQILRRDRDDRAAVYYQEVMQAGKRAASDDAELRSMAARSLAFAGYPEQGVAVFNALLKDFPDDRQLKADYSAMLVDIDKHAMAKESLANWMDPEDSSAVMLTPLSLSSTQATAYRLLDNGRKLLLVNPVSQNTDELPALRLPDVNAYDWLSYTSEGYSETLLVAETGYTFSVMQDANGAVWVHPVRENQTDMVKRNQNYAIQNQLIHARIDIETGRAYDASRQVRQLVKVHPDNAQVLGFAANVENYIGNWPYARTLIHKAHQRDPDNEDIIRLQRGIERSHAAGVYADVEWRALGNNDEVITTFGASYDINEHMQAGIIVQNNDVDSVILRRADGRRDAFEDNLQRGEVFFRYFTDEGTQSQISLFANNDTAGLGAYHSVIHRYGMTNVGIEYHRPYWEFVEGILDDATRDRVQVGHRYVLNDKVTLSGELGLNRYNTQQEDGLSSTVTLEGMASYRLMEIPYVSVAYGLDAEYETSEKNAIDADGIPFQRFPMDSREVHSLSVFGSYDLNDDTNIEGLASYGFDRISGDSGPTVEGRVTHYLTDEVSVQGRASYGFRGGAAEGDVTRAGVRLQYRY